MEKEESVHKRVSLARALVEREMEKAKMAKARANSRANPRAKARTARVKGHRGTYRRHIFWLAGRCGQLWDESGCGYPSPRNAGMYKFACLCKF